MRKIIQWWHVGGDAANVLIAGFILAATASNLAGEKAARTAFLLGGLACVPAAIVCYLKGNENEPFRAMQREAEIERFATVLIDSQQQKELMPANKELMPANNDSEVQLYPWQNAINDACGVIIAGQAGFGKSTLALWFLGLFTQNKPAYIKVLDPHGRINNWEDNGLSVVYDFDEIESELSAAIGELDRRRKMSKQQLLQEPDYIYVADEISACLDSFDDPKSVSKALRRLGCEGRKYHVSLIAIAHSHNADALGIDAKQRSNYLLVLLGDSARQVASNIWKKESPECQWIETQAYPCMVSGSVRDMPAVHPTHGHHSVYKKEGNPPSKLLTIHQIDTDSNSGENERSVVSKYLESLYRLPGYTRPIEGEKEGEMKGEIFHPDEKEGEIFSPLDDEGEKSKTQSGQDFFTPGEKFPFFPDPDHDPSDGCVQGGEMKKNQSLDLDKAALVLRLRKQGKKKTEIIKALGYNPGKRYQKGKDEYDKIEAYWRKLDLW